MLMFILNVFSLLEVSSTFLLNGPEVCDSENEVLHCYCTDRENITISANMNFDVKYIEVKKCGTVNVPLGAITHLQLDKIEFVDILTLEILPFALVGVQTIDTLRIEDILDFKVRQHGFAGLFNVTNLIIRNVTSSSLLMGSFGGVLNVQNFLIENSRFDEIEEAAFILTNISSFKIINSQIRVLESISLLIHNTEEIVFENCDIHETSNCSISMSDVDYLSFLNCRFGIIAANSFYTVSLKDFSFKNCSVDELNSDAFGLLHPTETIIFKYNVIKIAENFSLISTLKEPESNYVHIDNCCNSFTCDCNIFWLWASRDELYSYPLLETSFCIDKPGVNLSYLEPVLDSNHNCMTLELKGFDTKSNATQILNGTSNIKTDTGRIYEVKSCANSLISYLSLSAVNIALISLGLEYDRILLGIFL